MNRNSTNEKNATTKAIFMKMFEYALCFLIGFAVILGVKSCVKSLGRPVELKEAKELLKREGFSCKYIDEDALEDFFNELDFQAKGAEEALIAYDEDSGDYFFVVCCDDISSANNLEEEFAWELAVDDYLYYRGYIVKVSFRTVYFGHKDLITELLD